MSKGNMGGNPRERKKRMQRLTEKIEKVERKLGNYHALIMETMHLSALRMESR